VENNDKVGREKAALDETIKILRKEKLTRDEMIMYVGRLLVRIGYTMHFRVERPSDSPPLGQKITSEEADRIFRDSNTSGSILMKIGSDLPVFLLQNEGKHT
jgi:hypothetical protein